MLQAQTRPTNLPRVETYQSAAIDADGNLVITRADQEKILIAKVDDQTSFEALILSPDRTAVGAQALFANCCTSYDIPLRLVVYANGKAHWFTGIGLPIFHWHFSDHGTRVAYSQETVHFACSIHYELRDIESERLVESADIAEECGQFPLPKAINIPTWVTELNADWQKRH